MNVILTIVGILIGGILGYWWRDRSTNRQLPTNAVWLFKPKGTVNDSSPIWKVNLFERHNWWDGEPMLWRLPVHEHPFALQDKHSLLCADQERINISCTIKVTPKRDVDTLEALLGEGTIEEINDVSWVFQKLQSSLRTSTSLFLESPRNHWLQHPDKIEQLWKEKLNAVLTSWECSISVELITPTPDKFYQMDNLVEKEHTLLRNHQRDRIAEIEEEIDLVEQKQQEVKEKNAQLKAKLAESAELEIKWTALENHLNNRRGVVIRNAQEKIEAARIELRHTLGLVTEEISQDLNTRTPPTPVTESEQSNRNIIDEMLDSEKALEIQLIQDTLNAEDPSEQ